VEKISRYDVADHNSNLFPMLEGEFCYFEDHEQAIQKERQEHIEFLESLDSFYLSISPCSDLSSRIKAEISRIKGLK
jgi:hypothetical protein